MKKGISSLLAAALFAGCMTLPTFAEENASLDAFENLTVTDAKLGGEASIGKGEYDNGKITNLGQNGYFYYENVDFGENGISGFEFNCFVPGFNYYSNVPVYVSVIDGYTDGCIETAKGTTVTFADGSAAKATLIGQFTQMREVNTYSVSVKNGDNITGNKAVIVTYGNTGGWFENMKFTPWTAPTAYKSYSVKNDSSAKFTVSGRINGDIAGEHPNSGLGNEYAYAIFNSIDFGTNDKTAKYANILYANAYGLTGFISVISFGDYKYRDGDTVTWNGSVPTITRGEESFVGKMLLVDSAPPKIRESGVDDRWNQPTDYYKVKIGDITGVNTVMIAVKNYCAVSGVEFMQEAKSAYKSLSVADSDLVVSLENNGDITGQAGSKEFAYAIYNNIDFGNDETAVKYIKETYGNWWFSGKLHVFDMGDYAYKTGDTISFENDIPSASRNNETVGTGVSLMNTVPSPSKGWGVEYAEIVRPIGNISGTHTIIVALQGYIRINKVEFMNTPITKNAYSDVLNNNNAERHNVSVYFTGSNPNWSSYFGNLDPYTTIEWGNVDFGDDEQIVNVKINAAMPEEYQNQPIGVLIDGVERGKFVIASTGGWVNFDDFTTSLSGTISGVHNVALRFYALGTGSVTTLTFEKVPYRVDFKEANNKVSVTFMNNADSSSLSEDNMLALGLYKNGNTLSDVAMGENILTFGIESSDAAVKLPDSLDGATVKAMMFETLSTLKPFMNAVSYVPKHTSTVIDARAENNILSNTWDFSSCGVYINAKNSDSVKNMCKDGWVRIGNVDFGDVAAEDVYINMVQEQENGSISVYADSMDSEPVATILTSNTVTGGLENPTDFTANLSGIGLTGVHDIYLKFNTNINGKLNSIKFD